MVIILCKRKEINKRNNKGEKKTKLEFGSSWPNVKRKKGGKHSVILG